MFEVGDKIIIKSLKSNVRRRSWSDYHDCEATVVKIKREGSCSWNRCHIAFDTNICNVEGRYIVNTISFRFSEDRTHPYVIRTGEKVLALPKIKKHGFK